nr:uncharacterized protein LOC124218451 [Neodiprion pinetum]
MQLDFRDKRSVVSARRVHYTVKLDFQNKRSVILTVQVIDLVDEEETEEEQDEKDEKNKVDEEDEDLCTVVGGGWQWLEVNEEENEEDESTKVDEDDEDLCTYLTTVIPYHMDNGPPHNQALQVLIKILKAINEDSPTVPTLLTDYILKVLCPTY